MSRRQKTILDFCCCWGMYVHKYYPVKWSLPPLSPMTAVNEVGFFFNGILFGFVKVWQFSGFLGRVFSFLISGLGKEAGRLHPPRQKNEPDQFMGKQAVVNFLKGVEETEEGRRWKRRGGVAASTTSGGGEQKQNEVHRQHLSLSFVVSTFEEGKRKQRHENVIVCFLSFRSECLFSLVFSALVSSLDEEKLDVSTLR